MKELELEKLLKSLYDGDKRRTYYHIIIKAVLEGCKDCIVASDVWGQIIEDDYMYKMILNYAVKDTERFSEWIAYGGRGDELHDKLLLKWSPDYTRKWANKLIDKANIAEELDNNNDYEY